MPSSTKKKKPLIFRVVEKPSGVPKAARRAAFLIKDAWDDWGKYQTQFHLVVFDASGIKHEPGEIKIASINLKASPTTKEYWKTILPQEFTQLDETFFSLGQDESYYVTLMNLKEDLREQVLDELRDIAADQDLWRKVRNELVTTESLLRFVKPRTVERQFWRILSGGVRLTPYNLTYTSASRAGKSQLNLSFKVEPESEPPTNIHVLIGSNGVGKTFLLQQMVKSLVSEVPSATAKWYGKFATNDEDNDPSPIANVVSVSFSAFDHFVLVPEQQAPLEADIDHVIYSYVGLRRASKSASGKGTPKSGFMLATEFVNSVAACLGEPRLSRWRRAIKTLEADPIFTAVDVSSLSEYRTNEAVLKKHSRKLFNGLSSGHKLVLLTISRLVETVDEQTLILFDEPETHLHPPLLSAFIRALSDLLINRNALAILATHSPVVIQEVPKSCVWVIQRAGYEVKAERPTYETFGENVGILTREVFGLQVTHSGFYQLIGEAVHIQTSFESSLAHFEGELGGEAKAILRALFVTKDKGRAES